MTQTRVCGSGGLGEGGGGRWGSRLIHLTEDPRGLQLMPWEESNDVVLHWISVGWQLVASS